MEWSEVHEMEWKSTMMMRMNGDEAICINACHHQSCHMSDESEWRGEEWSGAGSQSECWWIGGDDDEHIQARKRENDNDNA